MRAPQYVSHTPPQGVHDLPEYGPAYGCNSGYKLKLKDTGKKLKGLEPQWDTEWIILPISKLFFRGQKDT